ncbi:hypothetical protein E1286_11575 [Nonomuraea terrae]|uniref:DUF6745 domain-containing protein n=1 Tax=Nonomuraea terrae TaxID=2530383 RepID=A0A4R4YZ50_9ACTN|nr:hypothetical protein [Nonomuraea terrae]TDD50838.1 hypothetical protein E1286_11575 [Nonomuraea terrae]
MVRHEAAAIREQWLGRALSTRPTDRPAAEAAISGLYRLIGLSPPRFHWVASPAAALETMPPGAAHSETVQRLDAWPVPTRLRALRAELCAGVDLRIERERQPVVQELHRLLWLPLGRSIDACLLPALNPRTGRWYETQSVSWIAHYDALRRVAGVSFTAAQLRVLALWARAAAACHWWWPRQHVCVVSERPVALHTEEGGARLHNPDGPALRYADGWRIHALHGTRVPDWVLTDPTPERIADEPNVEVRRSAIERLGWSAYVERAGLRLVASAPDPGNPGFELRLYDTGGSSRVLLAVNGSLERDGSRRQYGLTVPPYFGDPVAAAGWTYGLSADQYSRLLRRT